MSAKEGFVEELKKLGLNVGENVANSVAKAAFNYLPKLALESENKIDDMFVPVLELLKPKVFELIDKIDGEVG